MKADYTMIAWNGGNQRGPGDQSPAGAVAVGPFDKKNEAGPDWISIYNYSFGARRDPLVDYYRLTYSYNADPYVVHRALLLIDEYQAVIKKIGLGPAPGEYGHDPYVSYGTSVPRLLPKIRELRIGPSYKFWPLLRSPK